MGEYMYWYRVEYRESFWDTENTLRRVAYISAPENATFDCIHFNMYSQLHFPITTDGSVFIEKFTPVEKTIVSDSEVK